MKSHFSKVLCGTALALGCTTALAEQITVTDIAGREVTLEVPVERMILGEGRQIYLLGAL
ncbi:MULTISPECIES: hypothetical protein [Halomonadaceae]|nr:hypothetical protein [Halomonas antri]